MLDKNTTLTNYRLQNSIIGGSISTVFEDLEQLQLFTTLQPTALRTEWITCFIAVKAWMLSIWGYFEKWRLLQQKQET